MVRVRASAYVPDRSDVVLIDFSPQAGHEQAGTRPGLVISSVGYNGRSGLALVCPITNQVKGYWFEVALPKAFQVTGVVLADQIRNVDWRVRRARKIDRVPAEVMVDVLEKLDTLLRPVG